MECNVHVTMDGARQARFASPVRRWRACDRLRIEYAVSNHPQAPGPFGHEHRAIGKKRQAPRELERPCDGGDADALALSGVELHRLCRQLVTRQAARRGGDSALEWHCLLTGSRVSPKRKNRGNSQTEAQARFVEQTWPSHSENASSRGNQYRRGRIMRAWQPLPSLPHPSALLSRPVV